MKQRNMAIDVLRGFALLGIFVINVMSFSMPEVAYYNPTVYGGDDGLNRLVFTVNQILAEQKFMALFSMLFGASVVLLTQKIESRGEHSARVHYVRNVWLLIFGVLHGLLIWIGDVLAVYALSAFLLYPLRRWAPRWQLAWGMAIFMVPVGLGLAMQVILPALDPVFQDAMRTYWQPGQAAIAHDLALFRGDYIQQLAYRFGLETPFYIKGIELLEFCFLAEYFCRSLGMMLVGMALFQWGVLTGASSRKVYRRMVVGGFLSGVPLAATGVVACTAWQWRWDAALFAGRIPNHLATPLVAFGYIGMVMLWCHSGFGQGLRRRLAAVGRTALSNYIGQSLLATSIFYGFGLGLYGQCSRLGQMAIVLAVWCVQLALASMWMARFQYGPLEWLWRMLTYFRWQPLRRKASGGPR